MKRIVDKTTTLQSILIIIIVGLLIFICGILPTKFVFLNNVLPIEGEHGIRFDANGIAFTNLRAPSNTETNLIPNEFSIEIALRTFEINRTIFQFIVSVNDGNENNQIVIGQYLSSLICMNGNDYANEKGLPRIVIKNALIPNQSRFLTITSSNKGTHVYLDGQLMLYRSNLSLKIPNSAETIKLFLGNSPIGRKSWGGDILGLAFYDYTLAQQDVNNHYTQWLESKTFSFAKNKGTSLLYLFKEKIDNYMIDYSGRKRHLIIPKFFRSIKTEILKLQLMTAYKKRPFFQDTMINFFGFLPVGLIFSMLIFRIIRNVKYSVLLAVFICLIISLSIEMVQSVIPSRFSHVEDVVLNTCGGFIGTLIYVWLFPREGSR